MAQSYRVIEPIQRGSGGERLSVARHVADLREIITVCAPGSHPDIHWDVVGRDACGRLAARVVMPVPRTRPGGEGLVVQAGPVGPSYRDEPSDLRGLQWRDTGFLQLAGNQVAQRLGHVQAPIADDARGPEEQSLQFQQLRLSPIETPEGGVRVLDEVGRDDGFWPGVERSSVEQEPECCEIRSAVPLGARKRHRDIDETS